ncbi:MAG: hypothetical protein M3083_18810 [Actinomycetota bacterium]|nr:hypothetical protein [Actinomycetota bacterium]
MAAKSDAVMTASTGSHQHTQPKAAKRTVKDPVDTTSENIAQQHPELVERLNDGDPIALLDLLTAAGGNVKSAKIRVRTTRTPRTKRR